MERNTEKTKKKYFVVSDIHGYYNELVEALKEKGFGIGKRYMVCRKCGCYSHL